MILEALDYAASLPLTPAAFRPHIASSVSLSARARRCAKAWAEHEANSQAQVLETVKTLRERRTAVVLGSGLLRDVPIQALSKAFDTVVLVDLVHLASVRLWLAAKGLRNTRLIHRDLSGFTAVSAGQTPEPLAFLRQVPYLDLVVSANILSQIGVAARARLAREGGLERQADILPVLIKAHLEGLCGLPCHTCLITDVAYRVSDRQGRVMEEDDLLAGMAMPAHRTSWDWPVVPFGEGTGDYQAVHRVIAG
ncbi:hypothetical protein [Rhizobium sp. SSA_523]|uniref:hypothetical protein n=1 Tax=Rhizobium sp. SSA_523 TaxID=2952477 RepID=UPI0020913248|nr:hypothetical protein [Rhizobium sp. SSA_523]MCO5733170.1 hypothetical protein [Rhizobium sp. SSA_523]WKC24040.1 hypothetical protein QTJ18_25325 [Rhizobium sp. SSA_523]